MFMVVIFKTFLKIKGLEYIDLDTQFSNQPIFKSIRKMRQYHLKNLS